MFEVMPQEVVIGLVRSPHLAAACACFDCRQYSDENKTYRLCILMQTQQKKKSKRKGGDVFKETTTNCDVPSQRVFANLSFEDFV